MTAARPASLVFTIPAPCEGLHHCALSLRNLQFGLIGGFFVGPPQDRRHSGSWLTVVDPPSAEGPVSLSPSVVFGCRRLLNGILCDAFFIRASGSSCRVRRSRFVFSGVARALIYRFTLHPTALPQRTRPSRLQIHELSCRRTNADFGLPYTLEPLPLHIACGSPANCTSNDI